MLVRRYINAQNKRITITVSNGSKFYKDTEETKISEFDFKDGTAFWWTDDSLTHFVWRQDGVTCNITAECSIDEVIKTAENIKNN